MAKIEKAKNHEGKTIFPVTVSDAVLMGNGKTLKGELSELGSKENIVAIQSKTNDFRAITFVRGETKAANGEVLSNAGRIVTPSIIYTSDRVTIIADNGFRFYLALYNADGSYRKDSGWLPSEYTIPAGTYFRIIIARTTEVTGEVADISEFASSVKFTPEWYAEVDKASNVAINSVRQIGNVLFIRGDVRTTGELLESKYRLTTAKILKASTSIVLSVSDGYRFYLAIYNADGTINKNTSWQTSEYTISAGTYFRIIVARATENTSETIDVQEFVNALTNEPQWLTDIVDEVDEIIQSGPSISVNNVWNFVNGDTDAGTGEIITGNYRVITKEICYAEENISIRVIGKGFRFVLAQYNSTGGFKGNTGWQTSEYTIPAGTYFRIIIARVTENYSETASIEEFTNAVRITSQWLTDINNEINNIKVDEFAFKPTNKVWNFINGDTNATTGAIISAKYRVVTKDICHVDKTTTLKVGNGFRFFLSLYNADGSYIQDTGWQTLEYTISAGTYFRIIVARVTENTNETASVEEFANAVRITPEWYADIIKKSKENPVFMACVTPRKVRYIQHRGMITEAPENSIPAFVESGKRGVFGVECDVITTSDNILVLMHDYTIDRTTNGTGPVADYTYKQLKQFRIDTGANLENYSDSELQIPLFEDYLKICKRYGMVALIEIKRVTATSRNKLVELLHHYGMKDSCMIMTYLESELSAFRKLDESINLTYLVSTSMAQNTDNVDAFVEKYKDMPNFGYTLDYNDFDDKDYLLNLVRRINSYNQLVCMCTADSTDKEEVFAQMLTDIIVTDAGTIS